MTHPLHATLTLAATLGLATGSAFAFEPVGQDVTYDVGNEVYSGAPHAFTVFGSDRYQQRADEKSWAAFQDLLTEVL